MTTINVEWAQKNGYLKLPSALTFKEDVCALFGLEIGNVDKNMRASGQIFTRRVDPTNKELMEVPF